MPDPVKPTIAELEAILADKKDAKVYIAPNGGLTVTPPVSPTGQPRIPASLVPYILGAMAVVGALLACGIDPDGPELPLVPFLARFVTPLTALEGLLGALLAASPGLRKIGPVVLLVGAMTMSGCATFKSIGRKTVECSNPHLMQGAGEVFGKVGDILRGSSGAYRDELDRLALQVGAQVVLCAVQAAYTEALEAINRHNACGPMLSCYSGSDPMAEIAAGRANAYLDANGYSAE
jgi:hypothetical protein